MSKTATNLPLATAGAIVLACATGGLSYELTAETYNLDSYVTEEIVTRTFFAEEMAAWGAASDQALLNDAAWE
jgi:hypothetical protein